MASSHLLRIFFFIVLFNLIPTTLFAQSHSSLALAKQLAEMTQYDATSTQIRRNASSRLIRLIAKTTPDPYPQELYEQHKTDQIHMIAKQYSEEELKKLIQIYQDPLMNKFLKEFHKLVLVESTSLLPLYIFQENVKLIKPNAKLPHDQKKQYLKLTNLSASQLQDKNLTSILESEYYKKLVYSNDNKVQPDSESLINAVYQDVYKKNKESLAKSNTQEILKIMINYFDFAKADEADIQTAIKLSTDYYYFERNLEKNFNPNEIKQIRKTLMSHPIALHFVSEPLKIAAVLNNTLKFSSAVKSEQHLMMAVAGPIFKYTTP